LKAFKMLWHGTSSLSRRRETTIARIGMVTDPVKVCYAAASLD